MAGSERWIFSKNQLLNTPSRKCGIDVDKEFSYRQQAANFIQDMGQRLQVTQLCINTAIVYMHRFYMFHSFTKFHRNAIAACALFLAAKVEEQPRKLEHVIKVAHMCLHRDAPPLDTKSETYMEQAHELVCNENILLQTLGFEIGIDHPHTYVVKCCQLVKASKDIAQTSYFLATDSLQLTTMCLQCRPTTVSCVCIKLACERSNWDLPQLIDGREWFWFVDKGLTREILEELAAEFSTVLEKCPSRVKRKMQSLSSVKKEVHSAEKHPKVECIKTGTPVRMIEKPSQDCKKDSALCNSASVSRPQAIIKPSTNGQSLTDHRTHINVNLVTNVTMPTENLMMKSDGQQEPSIAFCSVSQSLSENRQLANNYPSHIKCHSSILSNEEHRLVHNHPNSFLRSSSGNDALFQDFSSNDSSSKDFIQKLPTIQMVGTSVAESNVQRELSTTFVQSVSHSTSSSLPPIMKLEGSEVVGSVSTSSEPKYHSNGTSVCSQVNKDLNIMYKNDNSLDSKSQSSQETTHEKFKSSKRRSPRIEKMSNSFRSGTLTNSVKDGVKITAGTLTNSVKDGVKITSGTLTNSVKDGVKITSGTLLERTSKRKHHEKHKHKRSGKEKSTDYISSPSQPVSLKITIPKEKIRLNRDQESNHLSGSGSETGSPIAESLKIKIPKSKLYSNDKTSVTPTNSSPGSSLKLVISKDRISGNSYTKTTPKMDSQDNRKRELSPKELTHLLPTKLSKSDRHTFGTDRQEGSRL